MSFMQQMQYKVVFLCAQHWKAVQTMYSKGTKYSVKNHLQITHNGQTAVVISEVHLTNFQFYNHVTWLALRTFYVLNICRGVTDYNELKSELGWLITNLINFYVAT
jgi:hypothetical protein